MLTVIPSVQESIDEALSFLESNMNQDSALNDKAYLLVLSKLQGMIKTSLYQFAVEQLKRSLAITADLEGLKNIGRECAVTIKPASTAKVNLTVKGVPGTIVPITTRWEALGSGVKYNQDMQYIVGSSGESIIGVFSEDPGLYGNIAVGQKMEITSSIDGIVQEALVYSIIVLGSDEESKEDYRTRILDEIRTVGGGSNAADIRIWAQKTPNVKRAYPYSGLANGVVNLPGERTVYIESTKEYNADGLADTALLNLAKQYIKYDPLTGRTQQAIGLIDDKLIVNSIRRISFKVQLDTLTVSSASEDACKADIEKAIDEHLRSFTNFVEGLDPPGLKNNVITSVSVSGVVQDVVSSYLGSVDNIRVFKGIEALPFGSYTLNWGQLAKGWVEYV